MSKKQLTLKQSRFINFWFTTGGNATEAARLAGYAGSYHTLAAVGSENLKKPKLIDRIRARLENESMSVDEALWRMAKIGRSDISSYIEGYGRLAGIDLERLIEDGHGYLIKSIKNTKDGTNTEFHDKQKALEQILRYYKIDSPGVQVNVDQKTLIQYVNDWRNA